MTLTDLTALLGRYTYRSSCEADLQLAISSALSKADVKFIREPILSPTDRPDFLVGATVIEIKVKGSTNEVTRQLHRYAQLESVLQILLVTTRQKHLCMPKIMNGKPIASLYVGRL